MRFVPRHQARLLAELLRTFPVVFVEGPRQCGKSTLLRHALPEWTHLDLEQPAARTALESDVGGFLAANPKRIVFDEAQRVPELFTALRHTVDSGRGTGRFVLLGSAGASLMRGVSESLAGRVGLLALAPFSAAELPPRLAVHRWFWGGYPPVLALREPQQRSRWLDAYVTHFLERDLPALGVRMQPARLRSLWTMLTHVHGRPLNVSDLARSLGVSSHTVSDHLDVLEAAFMIRRLPPFYANVQKRLAKSPKLYIRDTGLLHFLAGLRRPSDLLDWPLRGNSFEGLVLEELAGLAAERMVRPELFHWRTAAGGEVDLLVKDGRQLYPIEVKLGASVDPRALISLRQCMADLGLDRGWVVYGGRDRYRLGYGIEAIPWTEIAAGTFDFGWGARSRQRA